MIIRKAGTRIGARNLNVEKAKGRLQMSRFTREVPS